MGLAQIDPAWQRDSGVINLYIYEFVKVAKQKTHTLSKAHLSCSQHSSTSTVFVSTCFPCCLHVPFHAADDNLLSQTTPLVWSNELRCMSQSGCISSFFYFAHKRQVKPSLTFHIGDFSCIIIADVSFQYISTSCEYWQWTHTDQRTKQKTKKRTTWKSNSSS